MKTNPGLTSVMFLFSAVLVIVAIFFGAKRLPELGKGLGSGIREFKSGLNELHADAVEEEPAPAAEQPLLLAAQATPAAEAGDVAVAGPAVTDASASAAAAQETL